MNPIFEHHLLQTRRQFFGDTGLRLGSLALGMLMGSSASGNKARAAAGERHLVLPREYRFLWRYKRFSPSAFQRFMVRFQQKRAATARARRGG